MYEAAFIVASVAVIMFGLAFIAWCAANSYRSR